ncbi:MAG TPA: S1 RNA-binding domain-containing protein [Candidatus Nanoarchaeia archaeon]|nr:S1 RNA-binding domain-containing protein [Candidatus Nanoarchaeia archaeon]
MFYRRSGYPEEDEPVVCTITNIQYHSVFAKLDEYDKSGMIHISEVSPGRIRNIRDFVTEGKKVICKVLHIDQQKGHIDLSLRRVTEVQKRQKNEQTKQEQKAEKIIESLAQQLKKPAEALYKEVAPALLKDYAYLFEAFSDVVEKNLSLEQLGLPKDLVEPLNKLILEKVKPKTVQISGEASIQSYAENGLELIQNTLGEALKNYSNLTIKYAGGGKYKFLIVAPDYKLAEKILLQTNQLFEQKMVKEGTYIFKRKDD